MAKEISEYELKVAEQEEPKDEPSHPTLRLATLEDIPELLELGRELHSNGSISKIALSETKARAQLERFVIGDQNDYLALVSHKDGKIVGALAAYAFEPVFSDTRIACEVLWYLRPEDRKGRRGLDMMEAYEYWAKAVKCTLVQYGWLESSPEGMKKMYERTGAELAELVYYKEL